MPVCCRSQEPSPAGCRVHCLYIGRLAVILLDEAPFGGLRRVWHLLVFNSSGRVNKGRKQWVAAIYEPLRYTPPSKTRIRICGARWFLTCWCCSVCCGVVLMMVSSSEVRRQGRRRRRVRTGRYPVPRTLQVGAPRWYHRRKQESHMQSY